ncbi:hypothetical protein [Bacillus sp. PK5-004]
MKPLRNKGYFLEASTVSGILDKMKKADLIERTIDRNNRRNILVEATQKSLVIRDQVEAATIELNKTALQNLSNDDKVVLKKALSTIINNFQWCTFINKFHIKSINVVIEESLMSFKRAGCDGILTYFCFRYGSATERWRISKHMGKMKTDHAWSVFL